MKVPAGSKSGDRIFVQGFDNSTSDVVQLNPKKKVWEKIQSELRTNSDGEVMWRDFSLINIHGENVTSSLINCNVK